MSRIIFLLACSLLLPACVTERVILPARPTAPTPQAVATTARFETTPLGTIRYDGITLPLVSPDGRFIASQLDPPPSAAGLLAVGGDPVSAPCRVAIYTRAAGTLVTDTTTTRGILLGRSATDQGFLVEEPRPDGSRRIGRADWLSGAITWLADDPEYRFSHAIELRDGTLVYSRTRLKPPESAEKSAVSRLLRSELVIQPPAAAGTIATPVIIAVPDADLYCPIATPSQRHVAAIAASRTGLELVCVPLTGVDRAITTRCRLSSEGDAYAAFQAVAGAAACPVDIATPDTLTGNLRDMLQVNASRFAGAILVSASDGQVVRVADRAIGTCLAPGEPLGILVSRADVAFVAASGARSAPLQVSKSAMVCRAIAAPGGFASRAIVGSASAAGSWEALGFGPCDTPSQPSLIVTLIQARSTATSDAK